MSALPRLVGMVHLGPLPGAPGFAGDLTAVIDAALADAMILTDTGFDALMIENFGDAPFYPDDVPKATIAAMTRAVGAITQAAGVPTGVNVLRNDALGAVAVAAATGARFIRVNVLGGTMFTDQGPITGRAAEVVRARDALAPEAAIWADVFVKHAVPPAGLTLDQAVGDLVARSGAGALVVSGSATGSPPDPTHLQRVRELAGTFPIVVGSGTTPGTVAAFLDVADAVIVGTAVKVDGISTNPVDPSRAAALVRAARN